MGRERYLTPSDVREGQLMLSNAVDAAREQDPSQVVTVGDLTSQARGTGARKSAGKPEWYQFPFWAVTPLIHRLARRDRIQGVTEYALVVKDLVEDGTVKAGAQPIVIVLRELPAPPWAFFGHNDDN